MADDSNDPPKLTDEGENAGRDDSIDRMINAASGTAATLPNIVTCLKVLRLGYSVDKGQASAIDHADDHDPTVAHSVSPTDPVGTSEGSKVNTKHPATNITTDRPTSATNSEASFVTAASRQTEQPAIPPATSSIDVGEIPNAGQPSAGNNSAAQGVEAFRNASIDSINDVAQFLRATWTAALSTDWKVLLQIVAEMTSISYHAVGMDWRADGQVIDALLEDIRSWKLIPGSTENEDKPDPSSATDSVICILSRIGWLSGYWPRTGKAERIREVLKMYARLVLISHRFLGMTWKDGDKMKELLSEIMTWKSIAESEISERDAADLSREEARNKAIERDENVRAAAAEMAEETRKAAAAKEQHASNAVAAKKLAENDAAVLAAEEKDKKIKRKKAEKRKRYKNNRSQAMV